MDSGCLVLQTPARARDEAARRGRHNGDNFFVLFEAVVASRLAHWHKGIYLLAAKWERLGSDGSDALVGVNLAGQRTVPRHSAEIRQLQAQLPGKPVQCLVGGPVGPDRLLALVPFEGELLQPLPRLVHSVEGLPSEGASGPCGALFAELRDVLQVLSEQTNLRPLGAAVFQGHAVWSSDQLLSEVARGSWGLARAQGSDLSVPEGDSEERWSTLWQQRQVVPRTSDVESPSQPQPHSQSQQLRRREADERTTQTATAGCIGLGACTIS